MLNKNELGQGAEKLLVAHGLFGSARNWGVLSKRLSGERQVTTVDMRNHGSSPWHESQTYADMADDLAQTIATSSDVLGHSMGGKAAMVLALTRPDLVKSLIVADIAPVAYAHSQTHLIEAMQSLDLSAISNRRDADLALASMIDDQAQRAFLLQSLDVRATPPRWMLNLDTIRAYLPDIIGFPSITGQFEGPTLFLSGAASDYVKPEHHALVRALFPNAVFQKIAGAGHWLHAENPRAFEDAVRSFLAR